MAILHFQNAVSAHMLWSQNFHEFLEGRHDSAEFQDVHRDDLCVIGKWLHGEGSCYCDLNHFNTVKSLHCELHAIAGQAVEAKSQSNQPLLDDLMGQMDRLRHELFMSWHALNDLIGALE
ncbi:MAG TPA: CZB domain-containing protein [Magnetovibrio sp.]